MQCHRFVAGLTQVLHRVSIELLGWQQIVAVEEWNTDWWRLGEGLTFG